MTAYVLVSEYTAPIEEVNKLQPEHKQWVEEQVRAGRLYVAGRRVPATGGVIVIEADSDEELESVLSGDPYVVNRVAAYDRIAFTPAFTGRPG